MAGDHLIVTHASMSPAGPAPTTTTSFGLSLVLLSLVVEEEMEEDSMRPGDIGGEI